jgi:hypothetical protein
LARPSGIEAEEPGESPVLLGILKKFTFLFLTGLAMVIPLGILGKSSQKNSFGGSAIVRSSSWRDRQDTSQTRDWERRPKVPILTQPKGGTFGGEAATMFATEAHNFC